MKKESPHSNNRARGAALVSAILALTILVLIVGGIVGVALIASEGTLRLGARTRAAAIASEGMEALRSIRDNSFPALSPGTYGVSSSGGTWQLTGSPTVVNDVTRTVDITSLGTSTREVTVTVSWSDISGQEQEMTLISRLTDWQADIEKESPGGGGGGGGNN